MRQGKCVRVCVCVYVSGRRGGGRKGLCFAVVRELVGIRINTVLLIGPNSTSTTICCASNAYIDY